MFNLFGKSKIKKATDPQSAIRGLQSTIDTLVKRECHLTKEADKARVKALESATHGKSLDPSTKTRAIALIRKSKLYRKQAKSITGQIENLEQQLFALQQTVTVRHTMEALRAGKAAMSTPNPDDVAELMDDLADAVNVTDEISDILGQSIGQIASDDELELELEAMDIEGLPIATRKPITTPNNLVALTAEEELAELEVMMGI